MTKTMKAPKTARAEAEAPTAREKLAAARTALKAALVERDGEVDMVLTALVAREHPLLVGPPGTGKSMLGDALVRLFGPGTPSFSILLTKFSTPEEVFGPVSVVGLKADRYTRITTGKLPEARVGFLDEIFKASSAILNTTLRILNERVYNNGDGCFRPVPLDVCVAASNEWPGEGGEGRELTALLDRFLFRRAVRPVSQAGRRELLRRAVDNDTCRPAFAHTLTPEELLTAHDEAMTLPVTGAARKALWAILEELGKEGVVPGDRRVYKSIGAARAYAWLCGSDEVRPEYLEVLADVLWDDPAEQPLRAARVVARIANPVGHEVTALLAQAEAAANGKPEEAVPKLQAVAASMKAYAGDPRGAAGLERVEELTRACYDRVINRHRDV